MLDGFECYWNVLRSRIKTRTEGRWGLEGLVVKRRRTNINNGKLSYRTQGGRLVNHVYTRNVVKPKFD